MKAIYFFALVLLLCPLQAQDCYSGEFYNRNSKKCEQCHISCAACNSEKGCLTCYDQMYLVKRGNNIECDLCYNVLQNCSVC